MNNVFECAEARPIASHSCGQGSHGGNLDRVQVIKGWLDAAGQTHEHIYDVAWSETEDQRKTAARSETRST
jgi:hypothetical protein